MGTWEQAKTTEREAAVAEHLHGPSPLPLFVVSVPRFRGSLLVVWCGGVARAPDLAYQLVMNMTTELLYLGHCYDR